MARPLFEIAKEVMRDWNAPSPQAKTYIKGMLYLLGMDDMVADLDASTAVRMFLLYAKEWQGPVASRVKVELQQMRLSKAPRNEELVQLLDFEVSQTSQSHCDLCEAPLGSPGKYVEAYTHWQKLARMCMHCNYFLSPGMDLGDGALFMANSAGTWLHLHGTATVVPSFSPVMSVGTTPLPNHGLPKPRFRYRLKFIGKKVLRKCVSLVRRWVGRPA